jgi:hypothetical protein
MMKFAAASIAILAMAALPTGPAAAAPGTGDQAGVTTMKPTSDAKARRHRRARAAQPQPAPAYPNYDGVRPGAVSNGPYWSSPLECFTDDGQGRYRPCSESGPN